MKFAQLGIIAAVLLLQATAQGDGNDAPESSPQESATRSNKLADSETTFPPVVRSGEIDEKNHEGATAPAPASAENATKADGGGGGSGNLYQNVALVFGVASFLYLV
uniref:Uncharacterized protein n=1 Tax=Photinus pyralis TaxID=7054 RepID=A0A1Y1LLB3_PHOPY